MRLRRLLIASIAIVSIGTAAIARQQQAAEAPASARPGLTRPAVAGLNGLVTTGHPIASSAGLQMLLKGGNAFDAAAAVGAMAPLGEPEMNGIGGNGFMTIFHKESGKVMSLSMAGAAPKALVPSAMTPETLNAGMKAGIVPGNLGGYLVQLQRFGTMSLAEVFGPAIEYAEKGYPIDAMLAQSIARGRNNLSKYPTSAKIFLPNGEPLKAGDLLKNPDYASTLRKLVEAEAQAKAKGATRAAAIQAAYDRFYKGDIAEEFDRFFKENGGVLTAADLAAYKPEWQEPLHIKYRGHDVYSNPATSRGGFEVLMAANLVEPVDLKAAGPGSPAALHAIIESIKISKADIYRYVADPAFVKVPTAGLISRDFAATRRALFDPSKAIPYPPAGAPDGGPTSMPRGDGPVFDDRYDGELHTTSFSIVDRFGNAVGCTPTLGGLFGNNVVVGNTGLLLNNGMRLGSTSPYPTDVNYVGAGKIPILNNSPVVVLKDGALAFVFGTPGGETIGQTEFQVLVNLIDFEMPVQPAIEAPRLVLDASPNFYKPGAEIKVQIEGRAPAATIAALKAMGHTVEVLPGWGSLGHMQVIRIDQKTGARTAGADPRRTGYAMGY
ncbi:MAG TPA: gamma-glutamyltransferase family protein [Vicinamibacterales bacterium]|jgi:gamma-glutamyltranspeptidase/glutathione hydrolase|nr:gamma-glutamyltransferase family protein [Vicinamibacterales bacterium]